MPHLLVVVAHPDDETFGTGSVLLHAAAAGSLTTVVCATLGEAGEAALGVVVGPEGLSALRERELRVAASMLGVNQVDLLGFIDSGMAGDPGPRTLCGTPVNEVQEAIAGAIARHRPDVVVTLDGGDGHRDHLVVRDAVLAATAETDIRVYLHALPRSLMHAWVLHQAGNEKTAAYTELPEIGTRTTSSPRCSTPPHTTRHAVQRSQCMRRRPLRSTASRTRSSAASSQPNILPERTRLGLAARSRTTYGVERWPGLLDPNRTALGHAVHLESGHGAELRRLPQTGASPTAPLWGSAR